MSTGPMTRAAPGMHLPVDEILRYRIQHDAYARASRGWPPARCAAVSLRFTPPTRSPKRKGIRPARASARPPRLPSTIATNGCKQESQPPGTCQPLRQFVDKLLGEQIDAAGLDRIEQGPRDGCDEYQHGCCGDDAAERAAAPLHVRHSLRRVASIRHIRFGALSRGFSAHLFPDDPWPSRARVRSPAASWRRDARTDPAGGRPGRSIRSGGWPRGPRRCRRGNTRRTGSGRASADRPGTWPSRRRPAAARRRRAGTCPSAGGRSPAPPRTASCAAPNRSDIQP